MMARKDVAEQELAIETQKQNQAQENVNEARELFGTLKVFSNLDSDTEEWDSTIGASSNGDSDSEDVDDIDFEAFL